MKRSMRDHRTLVEDLTDLRLSDSASELSMRTRKERKTSKQKQDRSSSSTTTDNESQDEEEDAFSYIEVKSSPGKGQGIFATRKIPTGTRILSERPLISLPKHEENDPEAIERDFKLLSKQQQKIYLKLFDAKKSRMTKVVSIYYSNCYNKDSFKNGDGDSGSCIGATASRFNHSCVPNVQFSWSNERGMMVFYAIKSIPRGKELLSNYEKNVFEVAARRKQKQQLHYGFVCRCEACEPRTEFWSKSDERRRGMTEARNRIRECEKRFEEVGRIEESNDPTEHLLRLESLLLREGLVATLLANTYRSMTKWAKRKNDREQEIHWTRKEFEICETCFGNDSARVKLLKTQIEPK